MINVSTNVIVKVTSQAFRNRVRINVGFGLACVTEAEVEMSRPVGECTTL